VGFVKLGGGGKLCGSIRRGKDRIVLQAALAGG
jgi:hypothetical protein